MMKVSLKLIVVLLALHLSCSFGQNGNTGKTSPDINPCLENAIQDMMLSLNKKYPKFENFTSALETSRFLYDRMLTQGFDATSLGNYCNDYKEKRQAIDKCPDNNDKTITVQGFALADFICMKRANDFSKIIDCLQNTPETPQCRAQCSLYAQQSHSYLDPNRPQDQDTARHFKAGDCKYLKCQSDCRRPIIDQKCHDDGLEAAALRTVFDSERKIYEGGQDGGQQAFPEECKEIISMPLLDESSVTGRPNEATGAQSATSPAAGATGATVAVTGMIGTTGRPDGGNSGSGNGPATDNSTANGSGPGIITMPGAGAPTGGTVASPTIPASGASGITTTLQIGGTGTPAVPGSPTPPPGTGTTTAKAAGNATAAPKPEKDTGNASTPGGPAPNAGAPTPAAAAPPSANNATSSGSGSGSAPGPAPAGPAAATTQAAAAPAATTPKSGATVPNGNIYHTAVAAASLVAAIIL